jgi:hypothetical protein
MEIPIITIITMEIPIITITIITMEIPIITIITILCFHIM